MSALILKCETRREGALTEIDSWIPGALWRKPGSGPAAARRVEIAKGTRRRKRRMIVMSLLFSVKCVGRVEYEGRIVEDGDKFYKKVNLT